MNEIPHSTDFQAPAALMKWPSRRGQPIGASEGARPYTIVEATLDECIRRLIAKPETSRHLYEIRTAPQAAVTGILSPEQVRELARLREFL